LSDTTVIHTGRKFRLEQRTSTGPDGRRHTLDVVVHPGAAVILPLLPDGRVLLERVYRFALGRELLELPAGTVDPPESPAVCAARELEEETGYRAGRITPLLTFQSSPGFCTETLHAFVATELVAGPPRLEAGELITPAPLTLAAALDAIRTGEITDGKTIATLLYYARYAT